MNSIDDFKNLEDIVKEQNYQHTYAENQRKKLFDDDSEEETQVDKDNRSSIVKRMFYKD